MTLIFGFLVCVCLVGLGVAGLRKGKVISLLVSRSYTGDDLHLYGWNATLVSSLYIGLGLFGCMCIACYTYSGCNLCLYLLDYVHSICIK